MKKVVLFFLLITGCIQVAVAQPGKTMNDIIVAEGEHLYNLEMMAWNSADYIYENAQMNILRGYLAYKQGNVYKCIYWNGAYDNLEVIHTFSSTKPDNPASMRVDNKARQITPAEQVLYDIKMQALLLIKSDPTFFTAPSGVRLNALFIEDKDMVKVYVIPGIRKEYVIPMGNDYLLTFSKSAQLLSKQKIHSQYFEVRTDLTPDERGKIQTFTQSKDPRSPYITPTDICNLLLYSDIKEIHFHTVFSEKYVSFFSLNDKSFVLKNVNDVD